MLLQNPIIITSRLCAGIRIGDGTISIEYSARPARDRRDRYRYYIDAPGFEHSDDDLQSGCQGGSLQSGLESLLSFLAACAESHRYGGGENSDLFPAEVAEWCVQNSDEISMMAIELSETPDLIAE